MANAGSWCPVSSGRWYFDPVECRVVDTTLEPARKWLSAGDALEHLLSVGLSREENPKRLVQWGAAGLLPARAFFLRERNERHPEGSLVPIWVWEQVAEGLWVRDLDWQVGSLRLLRYNVGPTLDVEAHGIEFDRAALIKLAPGRDPVETQTAPIDRHRELGRGRRKGVGGFAKADAPLIEEMRRLLLEEVVTSVNAAAVQVVPKARGSGGPEAKARRLTERYNALFSDAP
jgi:hypothetical protein